jgi:hypothetical protein
MAEGENSGENARRPTPEDDDDDDDDSPSDFLQNWGGDAIWSLKLVAAALTAVLVAPATCPASTGVCTPASARMTVGDSAPAKE